MIKMKKMLQTIRRKLKAVSHGLASAATIGASACALLLARPASAQVSSVALFQITNIPPIAAASVATNGYTNQIVLLTKNCALAFAAQFYQTNSLAAGSTVVVGGSFSIDTTNFGIAPFTLSGLANSNNVAWVQAGTNLTFNRPITIQTNWGQNTLSGYAAIMFNIFTNTSSTSAVYNAGCWLSRPTLNTQTY